MENQNERTTVWVPKEAFEAVMKLWKPEFSWIPVPVDRSLPPDQIAYIETKGPVSPLPPVPRTPKTPLPPPSPLNLLPSPAPAVPALPSPLQLQPKTPRTPLDLPPLATAGLSRREPGYFGQSPELETAITTGFSPANTDRPDTPSTATEPDTPATPRDSPGLPVPKIWRQSQQIDENQRRGSSEPTEDVQPENVEPAPPGYASLPWKMVDDSVKWKMTDKRANYRPKPNLKPAEWKTQQGQRDLKMSDKWQTARRDEAHWHGSEKGFAVRLDMNLDMEIELRGTVNGDITLSAEALYVSVFLFLICFAVLTCDDTGIMTRENAR